VDLDPRVLLPLDDQFLPGIELPLRARFEWRRSLVLSLGVGAGYQRVVDLRGNALYSGAVWAFPLTAGAAWLIELSPRYPIRLRWNAEFSWTFLRNAVDDSTLDTLESCGYPGHDERFRDAVGFTTGLWVEWSGSASYTFRVGVFYRFLQPVVEIDVPVFDPDSMSSQSDSLVARMDALGVGLGGSFYFR
jgi:hypothetical protein